MVQVTLVRTLASSA